MSLFIKLKYPWLLILVAVAAQINATELPQYAPEKHMGVASCASSVCHSANTIEVQSNIWQTEYRRWLLHDRHSKAYSTLLSPQSKNIAAKLGLANAATAEICLNCHADNVLQERRGSKFLITDGVGCEACHGGSEVWLSRHTLEPYSAERNMIDGMYPTAPLSSRAQLCVSCHVGNQQKSANHQIMGAGHPRLGFELDTFTLRQPEHYTVDQDYLQRKNQDNNLLRLLIGTSVHAEVAAKNLTGELLDHPQGHPDLTLYDCHSCHRSLNQLRSAKNPRTAPLKPGTVTLNDSSFLLLAALLGPLDPSLQQRTQNAIKQLHIASTQSIGAVKNSAMVLGQLAESAKSTFQGAALKQAQIRLMLDEVVKLGIRGEYQDYLSAEQAVMAMDALSFSLPTDSALRELVNNAYELTRDDESFNPTKFRQILQTYRRR